MRLGPFLFWFARSSLAEIVCQLFISRIVHNERSSPAEILCHLFTLRLVGNGRFFPDKYSIFFEIVFKLFP
nr:hypothetical protein BaRGS_014676 [Batillaria attramentaria]